MAVGARKNLRMRVTIKYTSGLSHLPRRWHADKQAEHVIIAGDVPVRLTAAGHAGQEGLAGLLHKTAAWQTVHPGGPRQEGDTEGPRVLQPRGPVISQMHLH